MKFLLPLFLLCLSLPAAALPSDEMFDKLKNAHSESEANDRALDIWASWMESGSATVDIAMERAAAAQAAGDVETARAMFDRVILIRPDYAEAWNRRASIFLTEENYPEALRDLNEALRLEPRHFGAWAGLGMLFETMSAQEEALIAYREALSVYPLMPQAKTAEGRLSKDAEGLEL